MRELGLTNCLRAETGQVFGVGGAPITAAGKVDIPISVSDEEARWTRVHILEGEERTFLLGRQFLRSFARVMFDWDKMVITLGKVKISIQEQAIGGEPLARARSVNQISNFSKDERVEGTQTDLNSDQQTKFVSMLKEFEPLFNDRPGRTTLCELAIETKDAAPSRTRRRRLPPQWEDEVNSKSPCASNVVLVTKKDGKKRFAIDYRGLNSATKKDVYGMPQVQAILDRLHGFQYFTVIDISAAYWCVSMREGDVEKTDFNTLRGLFEMTVMPFGLVNAQATFQR